MLQLGARTESSWADLGLLAGTHPKDLGSFSRIAAAKKPGAKPAAFGDLSGLLDMDGWVSLKLGGRVEQVEIDPDHGPVALLINGTFGFMGGKRRKRWTDMTVSEQETLVCLVAKRNQSMRELKGARFWPMRAAPAGDTAALPAEERERLESEAHEAASVRCKTERAKKNVVWYPITLDTVTNNHDKTAKGILYGLNFPWTEAKLIEFGPEWLTQAFWKAGTLEKDNRVMKIIPEEKIKITAGNNAGKFLFEVQYQRNRANLHTKLFAKVPFVMTPATKTDRLSSSVYKQPMDLCEIQTYRLFEDLLPVKTPKLYFGDISNETSNFILITERIPFVEVGGLRKKKEPLNPYEIEGPYDKCMDVQLRGSSKEYYLLLMVQSGRIAGYHKAGKMGSEDFVSANLSKPPGSPDNPMAFGMNAFGCSGEAPKSYVKKLDTAVKFFGATAKVVFPEYAPTEAFQKKYRDTMLLWNVYAMELEYYKCSNLDYVALGHVNLNIDNAYFWRDDAGTLDCGVIDWGGFGVSSVGRKVYWILNCSDFENIRDNLDDYMDAFITSYRESGGPQLDPDVFRADVYLTALANLSQMCAAIPNSIKMCKESEWETIKDRYDPRIAGNIDGKSTLRSTLIQVNNGLRMIEEMKADKALDTFIQDEWVRKWNQQAKTEAMIYG